MCFCEDRHNTQRNHKLQTFTEKSAGEKRSIAELHNSEKNWHKKQNKKKKNKQCPPTGSEEGFSLGPRVRLYSAPNCNLGCKRMWSEAGTPSPTKRSFTRLLVPHPLSTYSMPGAEQRVNKAACPPCRAGPPRKETSTRETQRSPEMLVVMGLHSRTKGCRNS